MKRSPLPAVALEVSPRAAKLMVSTPAPFRIRHLHASTLSEETEDPLTALRTLLETQRVEGRMVGVLFGRELFTLRSLELPSTDPQEIASMLELQLGKLTPYPRNEIASAWTIVGSFREGYTRVLLAIARKAFIDSVLQYLKSRGLTPAWTGVSTEGVEAWMTDVYRPKTPVAEGELTALIDIDFASTDCAILSSRGRLLFTHSISLGAIQLQQNEQATTRLIGELIRLPRILLHEEVKGKIGACRLTGSAAPSAAIVDQLTSQWGVAVEVCDSLGAVAATPLRDQARASQVSYTALVGMLAANRLPRIDLIPHEVRVSQALDVRAKHLARLAGSLAAALILAAVLYLERMIMLRSHLTQLQQRLASVEQTSRQVMERQRVMQRVRQWLDPSRSALETLRAVTAAADAGIAITQLSFTEDAPMKIRGTADAVRTPYEFVDRLKQQPAAITKAGCYVANAKSTGARGAEFEVVCGKSSS